MRPRCHRREQRIRDRYIAGGGTFEYDPAGHLIRTVGPDGTQRQTAFQIGKTIGTDERGHTKTAFNDGHGRLIQIDEQAGASTITTRYVHDALGRLRTITDHTGLVTTINYDTLGRQRTTIDPDRGTRTYGIPAMG
jgi:YD repeat-containing protein